MILKNYNDYLINNLVSGRSVENTNIIAMDGVSIAQKKSEGCFGWANNIYRQNILALMDYVANGSLLSVNTHSGTSQQSVTYGVAFGDGTTPPTQDDVNFSGSLISTISSGDVIKTSELNVADTYSEKTVVYTITNKSDASVTISEIGMFLYVTGKKLGSGTNDYYYRFPYMIERTLLESPITIEAGGVGQVTYTIRMNYPTA